ncbi:MAG TPA: mechanosensitive ion channel domain-containing protein [Stellaceae bacterium]|nr:mechanosensitive ion channel domain-containing protein [Stellaceae bacterium]
MNQLAASGELLEAFAVQLAVVASLFLVAWGIRVATRAWIDRLVEFARSHLRWRVPRELPQLIVFLYAWLLLAVAENVGTRAGTKVPLIGIAATLTGLWIVLRVSALFLRDALLARAVASAAWIIAALAILGLLSPTAAALDSLAINIGKLRLSLLLAIKATAVVAILLWAALGLSRLVRIRIQRVAGLSPSIQVLTGNLIKIALVTVALLIGLDVVGIDLTAFTVFSGAVGVGIGFGLQKIVSNFISGIILLLERSVKPGDVIEVGSTFGSITHLGARYASVLGRDGKEYLIPNESLITNQVVNWSYSSSLVRIDTAFGVAYSSDLPLVRKIATGVATRTPRVLSSPQPVCHATGFGDSAVLLLLRFWIEDPENGVTNVKSDVLLGLWDAFRENHIELPFPQRVLHISELPADIATLRAKSAVPSE